MLNPSTTGGIADQVKLGAELGAGIPASGFASAVVDRQAAPDRSRTEDTLCNVYSLGRLPYGQATRVQQALVARLKAGSDSDTLLFLEHDPVITLGRNARREHVLSSTEILQREGISLEETDRGGDVTFHGPGQLVGYPILDLSRIRKDVVWYVRTLEEALLLTLREFGLAAGRRKGLTGVWVDQAKVAAIGIHISRWVTSHGFALNLDTDLRLFRHIVPCGITEYPVSSVRELLGHSVERALVERRITEHLGRLLGLKMRWMAGGNLEGGDLCPPMC